jgi:hypothetical protein
VAVLTIDNPPVNALNAGVMDGLIRLTFAHTAAAGGGALHQRA